MHEAAVYVLKGQLTETDERGESPVEPALIDVCEKQWLEVERLPGQGFSSDALIAPYVAGSRRTGHEVGQNLRTE